MQFSDCVEHAENVTHSTANVAFRPANVALGPANVATDPRHECHQCGKNFKRNCNLTKHMKSCKGVHSLQCHICLKEFTDRRTKYRHLQECTKDHATVINNIINNTNNNINNTDNSKHVTNNITIIAFRPEDTHHIKLLTDHITKETLKAMLEIPKEKDMLADYTRQLMENPSNQCVKKTNMRSSHSSVHVGNNKWETRHDKEVYPKLVSDVASCFGDFITGKRADVKMNRSTYSRLVEFMDYMSENGYCADEEKEKDVRACHKELIQRTKGIAFDVTTRSGSAIDSVDSGLPKLSAEDSA